MPDDAPRNRKLAEKKPPHWKTRLKTLFRRTLKRKPPPARESFTRLEELQFGIIGRGLLAWLVENGPDRLQFRDDRTNMFRAEQWLVFTTNGPGLTAARDLLGEEPRCAVYLPTATFDRFVRKYPDPESFWHVPYQSYFKALSESESRWVAEEGHPVAEGFQYLFHVEGTFWGRGCGYLAKHLWKWDGESLVRVREAFWMRIF